MKVRVTTRFKDRFGIFHDPGETLNVSEARAERLKVIDAAEVVPEPEPEPESKPKAKRKRGRPKKDKGARAAEDKARRAAEDKGKEPSDN